MAKEVSQGNLYQIRSKRCPTYVCHTSGDTLDMQPLIQWAQDENEQT